MRLVFTIVTTIFVLTAPGRAQAILVNRTFPIVGVIFDNQAVQVNLSNVGDPNEAPSSCDMVVEFIVFDPTSMIGSLFKQSNVTLKSGQTQVTDLGVAELVPVKGKVPVAVRVLLEQTTRQPPRCRAAVEVIELVGLERARGRTLVAIGDPQIQPAREAFFPALTLVGGQGLRINAANMGDPELAPCPLALSISDSLGKEVARHEAMLLPGTATALDLAIGDPNIRPQLRATAVRNASRLIKDSCELFSFSVEIYDLATGITTLIVSDPEE